MIKELYRQPNGAHLYYRHLEFFETVDMAQAISNSGGDSYFGNASITGDEYFTGTESLEEAIKLARFGWEEGVSMIERYMDEIDNEDLFADAINRPEIYRDVQGTVVDVAGYIQGIPENMTSLTFEQRPARAVKIIVATSQHASVSKEKMIQKAASIFLAAEALRRAGYLLDITGVEFCSPSGYGGGYNDRMLYEIPIVRPGDYMSSAQLAFMLGHPSFLRRIIFAVNETEEDNIRNDFGYKRSSGYGMPETIKEKMLKIAGIIAEDSDTAVYILDKDDGFGDILTQAKKIVAGVKKVSDKNMGFAPVLEREFA